MPLLERLTEPPDLVHADDGCSEFGEGHVDVGAAVVAGGEPAELCEPCEGPLHDPSVAPELRGGLDTAPADAGDDGPLPAFAAAPAVIVGLVGV